MLCLQVPATNEHSSLNSIINNIFYFKYTPLTSIFVTIFLNIIFLKISVLLSRFTENNSNLLNIEIV